MVKVGIAHGKPNPPTALHEHDNTRECAAKDEIGLAKDTLKIRERGLGFVHLRYGRYVEILRHPCLRQSGLTDVRRVTTANSSAVDGEGNDVKAANHNVQSKAVNDWAFTASCACALEKTCQRRNPPRPKPRPNP